MRILTLIVMAAVVGAAIGAAMAYVETRSSGSSIVQPSAGQSQSAPGPAPRVAIDEPLYTFDTMQRGTSKSHEFVVRNIGNAPLTLHVLSTTCKCTVGDVPNTPIPPGESVKVKLEWSALINPGPFRQTATIESNDPMARKFELSVEGSVTDATGVVPPDFVFDKVMAGESKSADVLLMAFAQDELKVEEPELTNTETSKFFDVQVEPVKPAELPDPKAKAGVRVRITAKPGLRLGRFDQWLAVSTNIPDAETIKIPVVGRVIGNISIHGRLWNEDQGVLRLGRVKSSAGVSAPLNVVIRGDDADQVQLSVASVDPPELVAKLGAPRKLKNSLVHMPLVIEIPPGTPPMARLDIDQHDEARVVLKTNRPDVPEMVLGVRFAVEK